jgi:hypothetical protein
MTSKFSELVALTQIYLLQEHGAKDWIYSDPATYRFFKTLSDKNRAAAQKPVPAPVAVQAPVVVQSPVAAVQAPVQVQKEPIPKEVIKNEPQQKTLFSLEPLGAPKAVNLGDIRTAVTERLEQVKITEPGKPSVVIVVITETGEELLFIHNVAGAINRLIMPAEIVTLSKVKQDVEWHELLKRPGLRWILAFGETASRLPGIQKQMGAISVLLQPAATTILRDPQMKADLWKMLKNTLNVS